MKKNNKNSKYYCNKLNNNSLNNINFKNNSPLNNLFEVENFLCKLNKFKKSINIYKLFKT